MTIKSKVLAAAAAVTLVGGAGLAATAVTAAHASTPLVSASTVISNDPDSGGNGTWAYDGLTRTLTISTDNNASDCDEIPGFTSSYSCYEAAISDSGTAATIPGAYQPNQGSATLADQTGNKLLSPTETIPFTGSSTYHFYVMNGVLPDAADVQTTLDDQDKVPSLAQDTTSQWYLQAFTAAEQASVRGVEDGDWTWTYANGCESWTDSFANGDGQSTPISTDGEITGAACATPAPTPTPTGTPAPAPAVSNYGDEVNVYGNGFDVYQRHFSVNAKIAGWPATQGDPATHFIRNAEGSDWQFEAVNAAGAATGLCVSNPAGGYTADPGGPDGLVLRSCNGSVFQKFYASGASLVSAVNGQFVIPDGTGAQLSTSSSHSSWGGDKYAWVAFSSLP